MFGSKLTRANQGMGKGQVLAEKQVVEGRGRSKRTRLAGGLILISNFRRIVSFG